MPLFILTVLKVVFVLLLYFFVYRAIRSVASDLRKREGQPRRVEGRPAPRRPRPSKAKTPRSAVVLDERGAKVETIPLNGTTALQIGRADACQIQVADNYLSSFHARIFNRDGAWYVEDLGSTNGTYLNQRKVTSPSELHAGDRIKLGKTTLELRR